MAASFRLSAHLALMLLSLALLARANQPEVNSGAWLARELQLESHEQLQEALKLKNLPAPSTEQISEAPEDYEQLAKRGRFEEAIALIDRLSEQAEPNEQPKLAADRLKVSQQLEQSVQALMEKYDLKLPRESH